MNRIPFLVTLLPAMSSFLGCRKEPDYGGISLFFRGSQPYQYTNFTASISRQQNGSPVAQDGGSYSFKGDKVIENGKMMHITLED